MKVGFVTFSCGSILFGAGYVVGALIEAGCEVRFYNLNNMVGNNLVEQTIQDLKVRNVVKQLIEEDVEIVFFSILSVELDQAIDVVRKIKKVKNIPVMFGGVHPTIVGIKLLEEYPEIDYICVGEGESMVKQVVSERFPMGQIKNLGWRDHTGKPVLNPIREPEDITKPAKFPWHIYPRDYLVKDDGILYIRATRGCVYKCHYCGNSAYLNLYGKEYLRKRPIADIIEEMEYLKKEFNPKMFSFIDEMLIMDKTYATELFRLVKKKIGLPFGFMARVEHINESLVEVAAECGCTLVAMGVECGDEQFRKEKLNRFNSNAQIINAFALLKRYGIKTTSFNIIGYPFDGEEERIESTVKLNLILQPDYVQFSIFYPFPGTVLYDYCIEHDLIDKEKQKKFKNLYDESILKGVSLHNKRIELHKMFNHDDTLCIEDTLTNAAIRKIKRVLKR